MTIGELYQMARERVSTLNEAIDSIKPGTPSFDEATGRYEEAKVFLVLIGSAINERAPNETVARHILHEDNSERLERLRRWDGELAHFEEMRGMGD